MAEQNALDWDQATYKAGKARQVNPAAPLMAGAAAEVSSEKLRQLQHAREMAVIADNVYADSGSPPGFERVSDTLGSLPPELRDQSLFQDPNSGFSAALYKASDGHMVVAYRGTQPTSLRDWGANIRQAFGFKSDQQEEAIRLAHRVQMSYPPPPEVEITGHSLGGGLAALASSATGMPATTFNAAGVNPKTLRNYGVSGGNLPVTNYSVSGEILTTTQKLLPLPSALGRQVKLPPPPGIAGTSYLLTGAVAGAPGVAAESVARHSMGSVIASLDKSIANE
jgi:type VI secretion system secreted protein VgrG